MLFVIICIICKVTKDLQMNEINVPQMCRQVKKQKTKVPLKCAQVFFILLSTKKKKNGPHTPALTPKVVFDCMVLFLRDTWRFPLSLLRIRKVLAAPVMI